MPSSALLDASVIYPLPLRDTLLRVAATELYDPFWSARILDEVVRNLVADRRATVQQARRLIEAMDAAFDGAVVPSEAIERLEPAMTNDRKDRHVLAAAVAAGAQAVVTLNLQHFPLEACAPLAIDPLHPDDFLVDLYNLDADLVYRTVELQAAALTRPPMSLTQLLDRLSVTAPSFATELGEHR
jgi:predicted nucleic acid-binding protein